MLKALNFLNTIAMLIILIIMSPMIAAATDSDEELAKKTLNPVADLISLPLQFNQDYGIGPADAKRSWLNVQPVIPFTLNKEWNLITRTIIPLIDAESPVAGGDNKSGMGDITQSFYLSPKGPVGGWIMGFGPALLYPSATDEALGGEKWGAGPTGVLLQQQSGFTYGLLFNHIWSYAGDDDHSYVSSTFLQPFFSYTTKTYTSIGLNTESTYDWNNTGWTVPINFYVSQLLKIKGQPISLQLGYRYYAVSPDNGPDWGLRFVITFLFPK